MKAQVIAQYAESAHAQKDANEKSVVQVQLEELLAPPTPVIMPGNLTEVTVTEPSEAPNSQEGMRNIPDFGKETAISRPQHLDDVLGSQKLPQGLPDGSQ